MKIALSFPGCHRRGGVERVVLETARHLVGRRHEVHVFADAFDPPADAADRLIHRRHVPIRHRPGFLSGVSYFRKATRAINPAEFDVVNTHGCVCPTGHVHRVHSLHASWLETSRRFRGPMSGARWKQRLNPLHPVLLNLERRHFGRRKYKRVIALTEDVKTDLHRFYGVPPEDVDVVPNGFNSLEFNPQNRAERRDARRAELGLRPDQSVLLFVANELGRKGFGTILGAMRRLARPDLKLLVVGRLDERAVMAAAEAEGVAGSILFCGPTSDVAGFHAAADLFVLPTQYEAFCLAILEALGSGLPVVTSNVPGARDAIRPDVNGLLIDDPRDADSLADALGPLLDPDRRLALSDQAPATVETYRWDAVMAHYEQVLISQSTRD